MKTKDKGGVIATEQRRPIVFCSRLGGGLDQTASAHNSQILQSARSTRQGVFTTANPKNLNNYECVV